MSRGNIGKIKASRVNGVPNVEAYIGESGILFYNYANGVIRISDGITPGGVPIPYNIASNVTIGGIKAGPGVVISNDGELFIDTANLALSFGNFTANNNVLSIVNTNEDMYLTSSGTANINLIGGVNFFKPNGFPPTDQPFFRAKSDGQLRILVPVEDPIEGGIEIIGSATGTYIAPGQPGAMLQLTGNPNVAARMYMDSIGEYASLVGRRYNGNVAAPTQVLAGQDVLRFNATAATNAGLGNVAMAQMQFRALENQTTTAQGSSINFIVTPVGSSAAARVEVANINVANGVSATKFTTAGNVVANAIVSAAGSGGNIYIDCSLLPVDTDCILGSNAHPWAEAYFGPQSVTLLDTTSNPAYTVVIQNNAGNVTMGTAGFNIETLNTGNSIFRIEAVTGQIYSNANTIIQNTTQSTSVSSGSLQTAGGAGIAKNLYVGGNIVTSGNVTVSGTFSGHYTHALRDAGTIADGGTVTLNFTTDDIVSCVWNNGLTVNYANIIPGRSVRLIAQKGDGSGTDNLSLDGISANHTSTGTTTITGSAGQSYIIEFYSTTAAITGIYAKV